MKYDEIIATAISYSMRQDQETADMMDAFLRIVESRVNRSLSVSQMFDRAMISVVGGTHYYGLPDGFMSIRDIQLNDSNNHVVGTFSYVSPEIMNAHLRDDDQALFYTLIANQLQISNPTDNTMLEVVYRQRLSPLNTVDNLNWLSDIAPDIYIFGLLVEISAFAKDGPAGEVWNDRLTGALQALQHDDDKNRWSSPSLSIRMD